MNILEQIKQDKTEEVRHKKQQTSLSELKSSAMYDRSCNLLSRTAAENRQAFVIAEFKRQSPSKGIIRQNADPEIISTAYAKAGASAISVLTDQHWFGAQPNDFRRVRQSVQLPLLRKEFILDPWQVHETKAMGADIMLLIAAMLEPGEVFELATLARELGLDVLLELHHESELMHLNEQVTLAGINNRDLSTFQVDLDRSVSLKQDIPGHLPVIAESGLSSPDQLKRLITAGFQGFLIGESLMKAADPGQACQKFIQEIKSHNHVD